MAASLFDISKLLIETSKVHFELTINVEWPLHDLYDRLFTIISSISIQKDVCVSGSLPKWRSFKYPWVALPCCERYQRQPWTDKTTGSLGWVWFYAGERRGVIAKGRLLFVRPVKTVAHRAIYKKKIHLSPGLNEGHLLKRSSLLQSSYLRIIDKTRHVSPFILSFFLECPKWSICPRVIRPLYQQVAGILLSLYHPPSHTE